MIPKLIYKVQDSPANNLAAQEFLKKIFGIDRLSKYPYFMALPHPFTTTTIVKLLFAQVHELHGIQALIVSDHGSTFISNFWKHLFKLVDNSLLYNLT